MFATASQPAAQVYTAAQREARKRATLFALIATLGPFFYGFEGMVLNGAIAAVGSEFKLGPIAQV